MVIDTPFQASPASPAFLGECFPGPGLTQDFPKRVGEAGEAGEKPFKTQLKPYYNFVKTLLESYSNFIKPLSTP